MFTVNIVRQLKTLTEQDDEEEQEEIEEAPPVQEEEKKEEVKVDRDPLEILDDIFDNVRSSIVNCSIDDLIGIRI